MAVEYKRLQQPLSERLPIPPVSERTLDQHLLWLDVCALEDIIEGLVSENLQFRSEDVICVDCLKNLSTHTVEKSRILTSRKAKQKSQKAFAVLQAKQNTLTAKYQGELGG